MTPRARASPFCAAASPRASQAQRAQHMGPSVATDVCEGSQWRGVPTRQASEGDVEAVDEAHVAGHERGTCAGEARHPALSERPTVAI